MKGLIISGVLIFLRHFVLSQGTLDWYKARAGYANVFMENKGQVTDQDDRHNSSVCYIYSDGMFNLQLKYDGFSMELFHTEPVEEASMISGRQESDIYAYERDEKDRYELRSDRLDITFQGSDPHCALIPQFRTGAVYNFYTSNSGEDGITGIVGYSSVRYHNVYPGIDLIFYAPDDSLLATLKYEWIVAPGADPSLIELRYHGARRLSMTGNGSVSISNDGGVIYDSRIFAYYLEDGFEARVDYVIHDNVLRFDAPVHPGKTLKIDPNIVWFSYYGGVEDEDVVESEMDIDLTGRILLCGNTRSTQYIASTGAFQADYGGGELDAFVAKFGPKGKLDWATYYGGAEMDKGRTVSVDSYNNIFLGGNTLSSIGITTENSFQEEFGGLMDGFLVKFQSNGIREWATYLGGSGHGDQLSSLVCDASNNVYFVGFTASLDNIATIGAYQDTLNGSDYFTGDVMLGKFSGNGDLIWCSYFSGPGQDWGHSIALGKGNALYIDGNCESAVQFATTGVHQSYFGGGISDAFVSKWDTSGSLLWCSYYGGIGLDRGRDIETDSNGNLYLTGWTNSDSGMSTVGAFQEQWYVAFDDTGAGVIDGFLAKFRPDGSLDWATYYGGENVDRGQGLCVDKEADVIYFVGSTRSEENISTDGLFQPEVESQDGFISKFTTEGDRVWSYYVGGEGSQSVFNAQLDKKSFLYCYAITNKTVATSSGVHQSGSNGGQEALLIKLNPSDSCFDSFEPNDSELTPRNISIPSDSDFYGYNGVISEPNDTDWYRIRIPSTNFRVMLTELEVNCDLFLYDNNGALISSSENDGTSNDTILYNSVPKGKYLIKVQVSDTIVATSSCYRLIPLSSDMPWLLKEVEALDREVTPEFLIQIYPNPTNGIVQIETSFLGGSEHFQLKLFNQMNQQMLSTDFALINGIHQMSVDVGQLLNGMYLLNLYDLHGRIVATRKMVIQF